jgi:hypothetical protein
MSRLGPRTADFGAEGDSSTASALSLGPFASDPIAASALDSQRLEAEDPIAPAAEDPVLCAHAVERDAIDGEGVVVARVAHGGDDVGVAAVRVPLVHGQTGDCGAAAGRVSDELCEGG